MSRWAIHSHQGSIHLEACMMRNGDMQELRIWMHDCAFCVSALRHTCISMEAGCWAACCMLHAAELRSDALCASASSSRGDSAPFRRSAVAQTSPVLTPRLMLLGRTPCGMCNEISIAHHVRHHCDSALPRRLTRACTSCLPCTMNHDDLAMSSPCILRRCMESDACSARGLHEV